MLFRSDVLGPHVLGHFQHAEPVVSVAVHTAGAHQMCIRDSVCMAEYDATMPNCEVAYPPVELKNVLGQYLSENGKTCLLYTSTSKVRKFV